MVDYARLASYAKVIQDSNNLAIDKKDDRRVDPYAFFNKLKANIAEEMKKANLELSKRRAAVIGWNHLPGFDDEIFLTYGTDTLCRVGLSNLSRGGNVTAVISGPPNGYEISRKVYLCTPEESGLEALLFKESELPEAANRPRDVAINIISSILAGSFD